MKEITLQKFLGLSSIEKLRLFGHGKVSDEVKNYLGNSAYDIYLQLAQRTLSKVGNDRLSIDAPTNLIFVPGVMGSLLFNESTGGVWWIDVRTLSHLDHLALNEKGDGELNPNNRINAFTTDITYEPFFTAVLERKDFGHEIFPYDWRKSLRLSAGGLRKKILQTFRENGGLPVHLVGHSMGGLLIRTMLMIYFQEINNRQSELYKAIGRIMFIGTPHYGSPALAGYLKNHLWGWDFRALLGRYLTRKTFRTLHGVLSLLPAPQDVYPGTRNNENSHPCANFDMYDVKAWKLELQPEEERSLQTVLDEVKLFHQDMYKSHQALDQKFRDKMAIIAGIGYKTLFRLEFNSNFWGLWEHTDKITSRIPGNPHREGDSTVPLASAELENVYTIRYVKGEHGQLPMMPVVFEDVFRWLNGDEMKLPSEKNSALSARLSGEALNADLSELYSVKPPLDKETGEPDYWIDSTSDSEFESKLANLKLLVESGELPDFIKVKIL